MVTQTLDLNLVPGPGNSRAVAHVSQYDVGRQIVFNLYSGTVTFTPTAGSVIVCNGTKSNGTGFASSTTWSGNAVTVTTDAQMTDMAGISHCELVITVGDVRVGTANFLMVVEQAGVSEDTEFDPAQIAYVADALAQIGDAESVFDTLNARIDNIVAPSGDPTLTEVADARYSALTAETYASLTTRILSDDEYVDGKIGELASLGTEDKTSIVAAINELVVSQNDGLTDDIKVALLNCFRHVAWIDGNGQTYYNALYDALYEVTLIILNTYSISMSTIGSTTQLTATTTPEGATVTWSSSDTSIATVDSTGLVTSVAYGNATITATAGSATASCAVVVAQATVTSITAVYQQSVTVYDTDTLSVLVPDLTVYAAWDNGTTTTVASTDYTLSGTLTEGTSVITVSYGGQTTTFNVTVSSAIRALQASDIVSSIGTSAFSVDNEGTLTYTPSVTGDNYLCIDFNTNITDIYFTTGTIGDRYCLRFIYAHSGENDFKVFDCAGGDVATNVKLMVRGNGRYSKSSALVNTFSPSDWSALFAENTNYIIRIRNNVMSVYSESEVLLGTIDNADCFGIWGSAWADQTPITKIRVNNY